MITALDIALQLDILGHSGLGYTEIRLLPSGKQFFSDDPAEITHYVQATILSTDDVFIGINPRTEKSGTNADVNHIKCIVVDIDVKEGGTNEGAATLGKRLVSNYRSYVLVDSGRGCHVYIPIGDQPITSEQVKIFLSNLALQYDTPEYHIDCISDAARVIRVWGSVNSKNRRKCQIVEDHFNGRNTITLPETVKRPIPEVQGTEVSVYANGSRNQTLASLAGSMQRRGMSKESIEIALQEENQKKCKPPLTDGEVSRIVRSIARYTPSSPEVKVLGTSLTVDYFDGLKDRRPGTYTGFKKLDEMTGGIKEGHLWIIAGRPGQGKTTFCVDLAKRYAKQGKSVLYFSTEMGASSLYDKIISSETGVPLRKFLVGGFDNTELDKINSVREKVLSLPINIYEDFSLTPPIVEKVIKEVTPEVVIIDQLQSFKYINGGKPEEQGAVVQKVRQLSSDFGFKIILANQLNRAAEASSLSLGNLKGTGSGEELADLVIFIIGLDKESSPRPVDLHIMKARYGCSGIIRSMFHIENGLFEEI